LNCCRNERKPGSKIFFGAKCVSGRDIYTVDYPMIHEFVVPMKGLLDGVWSKKWKESWKFF
jgi:hypothetical protein